MAEDEPTDPAYYEEGMPFSPKAQSELDHFTAVTIETRMLQKNGGGEKKRASITGTQSVARTEQTRLHLISAIE